MHVCIFLYVYHKSFLCNRAYKSPHISRIRCRVMSVGCSHLTPVLIRPPHEIVRTPPSTIVVHSRFVSSPVTVHKLMSTKNVRVWTYVISTCMCGYMPVHICTHELMLASPREEPRRLQTSAEVGSAPSTSETWMACVPRTC